MVYSVAILTVSDTAFASEDPIKSDLSGPALKNLLLTRINSPFNVISSEIVPDEISEIQKIVKQWCEEGINLILTTGGTGFGVRDVTPEALTPLIHKHAPGLVTLMLTHSLSITPLAALSRPVAGVRLSAGIGSKGSLIISLPGSPKGSKENLESLIGVLSHALDLAGGGTGKVVHKALGSTREVNDGGKKDLSILAVEASEPNLVGDQHQHHHHHHHSHGHGHVAPKSRTILSQDPSIAAAARQRQSPYPLVPTRDAINLILANTYISPLQNLPVTENLVGYVMGEDVIAMKNIPEKSTTNVDGYAVRSTDGPGIYNVLTQFPTTSEVPSGSIYRINTGAPLPDAFDSVIMVEDTELVTNDSNTSGEELTVKLLAQVDARENVRNPGSDVKKGDKVLERGDVISAVGGELGTLAFVGRRAAAVHKRPIVAVLSTGNELVAVLDTSKSTSTSSFSSIPDSNRPSLLSILKHLHFETIDLGIVGDTMESTAKALKKGKEEADIIISTGGTSMGVGDLLKPCIETLMNGTIHFGRVAMKPGKPTTFATLPAHPMAPDQNPKLVFALPGNPAGALVTFFLFVLPALRKMEGRRESEWELPRIPVSISSTIYLDSRPEYHRVFIRPTLNTTKGGGEGGIILKASSTGGQRSSRTVSLAGSNGLLELPAKKEGEKDKFEEGDTVMCVIIGEIGSLIV